MNDITNNTANEASSPLLTVSGPRATLRLNRPREHNRLDPTDLNILREHVATVESDPSLRVFVLTGTGEKSFCSGYTLGALTEMKTESSKDDSTLEQVIDRIEALRIPTICALNGSVYGGGTDLALACDFRIGVTGTRMVVPAAKIGLHYYPTGMRRFVERIGVAAAKRVFLIGEAIPCEEMLRVGYLDELVAPTELVARTDALAATLCGNAPVINAMKGHLNRLASGEFDYEAILRNYEASVASSDLKEGLAAMMEKRAPKFTGQ